MMMPIIGLIAWMHCLQTSRDATDAIAILDTLNDISRGVPGLRLEMRSKRVRIILDTFDLFSTTVEVFVNGKSKPLTNQVLLQIQKYVLKDYLIRWTTGVP